MVSIKYERKTTEIDGKEIKYNQLYIVVNGLIVPIKCVFKNDKAIISMLIKTGVIDALER